MLTTDARKQHRSAGFRVVSVACAMMTVLGTAGVTRSVAAADRIQPPPYDRRALSEIARDVLRNGATGVNQSVAEPSLPGRTPGLKPEPDSTVADTGPDEAITATDIAPALKGIVVPIDPLADPRQQPIAGAVEAVGYHSNSWRQRIDTGRGLSFSSGHLAPASGLDPALAAHTHGLRAEGRQYVYGFLLLRVPLDEALQNKLAGLDVELLGPHDDHHKARLPMASLQAIAAMPEVEWVGVSAQWQKLSSELSALRGGKGQAAVVGPGDSIPIVINLFDGDDNGSFRRRLEAAGATLGRYDADLRSYRAVATGPVIDTITGFDFVLFVELIGLAHPTLDESTPLIDGDLIRPGSITYGIPRFSGYSIPVGIMDSGFRMGANGHDDLYFKEGCARNFTDDGLSAFNDQLGHGTHVLGIIAGTGSANSRYRGMAPSVGLLGGGGIRAAKIFKKDDNDPDGAAGNINWSTAAMDWMTLAQDECGFPMPWVVNYSGGGDGNYLTGTDDESRRLDLHVFNHRQLYVVAAGNRGSHGSGTIGRPGVAKNALTVGSVLDVGVQSLGLTPGDISFTSSRGPTGDGRMKPNVVAPGHSVTSASASDLHGYRTEAPGTSFAAPLVTGLAATLMEHYLFELDPALLRAHLMATALSHDNVTGKSNDYGLGRVSGWVAHWDHTNTDGWSNSGFSGLISTAGGYHYRDLLVPPGTKRLSIVMTWDELPASSGASRAVMWDLDLWADQIDGCSRPVRAVSVGLQGRQRRVHRGQQSAAWHVPLEGLPDQRAARGHSLRRRRHGHPRRHEGRDDGLHRGAIECARRRSVPGDDARREPFLRGVGRLRGPDHAATGRDADRHRDDPPGRREHALHRSARNHDPGQPSPRGQPVRHLVLPADHARTQDLPLPSVVGERGRDPPDEDGAGRFRHEPGADRDGDEPVGAASGRRSGVLGHRHGAEHGDGAVRILHDALLPVGRRDQERR
jgi:subtilisin family serine protease